MSKLLILLLLGFSLVANASQDWELIKDKESVQVYSTQQPGYELEHFKGQTQLPQKADTILAALQDTKACPEWVYNCISNAMVDMVDVRTRIYHTTIDAPLWFKDRDFYLQSHIVYEPTIQSFIIRFESKPDYQPENNNRRRITDVEMMWILEEISDKKTSVTYQVYIDPKLPFKSINHAMIKKSVFETLQGLSKIVQKSKYAKIKYSKADREMLTE